MEAVLSPITQLGDHWLWLALSIVVASWIWEDGAVFLAAIMALDGKLSPVAAYVAALLGITSGDAALYMLGRLCHRWRWLRLRLFSHQKGRLLRRRFRHRTFSNIFLIRFVPGLRTLGFSFCGFWRIPIARFLFAMILAGVVWTTVIFVLINLVGMHDAVRNSSWKWVLMVGALVLLLLNNIWAGRLLKKKVVPDERK